MSKRLANVLVTGSRAPVAIVLARTLRNAGFTVFTGDSIRPTLGQYSRVPAADIYLPPPRFTHRDEYAERIAALVRQHEIQTIIPTCEETFSLSAIAAQLRAETGARVFSAPLETLNRLHDKFAFSQFAETLGLPVPKTLLLGPEAGQIPHREGIVKRTYSRFGEQMQRVRAGSVLPRLVSDSVPWIWQEWVEGKPVSSYSLCVNGAVRAHVAYQTPYTLDGGAGICYEAVEVGPSLNIAARMAEATAYTGQLSLDFIEDVAGTLRLIECNPRATMGLALLSLEPTFPERWRSLILAEEPGSGDAVLTALPGRTAQLRIAMLLWGERRFRLPWLKNLVTAPEILTRTDDPGMLRGQIRVLSAYRRQSRALGCSLTAFTTHDIEWNGLADARTAQQARSRPLLLETFPELSERFAWTPLLAGKASCVAPAPTLSRRGEADVWVKRDDLVCPHYGGNKARKFEWILGDLRAKGHRELWTVGGLCSNHCLAAAVYGSIAGIAVRNFFVPTPLSADERDLLRIQQALGASLVLLPSRSADLLRLLDPTAHRPYLVPPGGSSVCGVLGYVEAGLEFCRQVARGECPSPDVLYIAAASWGTVLGLAMGLRLGGINPPPAVIAVETSTPVWQRARTLLPTPTLALHRLRRASPELRRLLPERIGDIAITTDKRFQHLALGQTSAPIADALAAASEEAQINLDAHYSARAYAALRLDLAAGRLSGKTVLFWHTHGALSEEVRKTLLGTAPPLPPDVARAAARCLREEGRTLP